MVSCKRDRQGNGELIPCMPGAAEYSLSLSQATQDREKSMVNGLLTEGSRRLPRENAISIDCCLHPAEGEQPPLEQEGTTAPWLFLLPTNGSEVPQCSGAWAEEWDHKTSPTRVLILRNPQDWTALTLRCQSSPLWFTPAMESSQY